MEKEEELKLDSWIPFRRKIAQSSADAACGCDGTSWRGCRNWPRRSSWTSALRRPAAVVDLVRTRAVGPWSWDWARWWVAAVSPWCRPPPATETRVASSRRWPSSESARCPRDSGSAPLRNWSSPHLPETTTKKQLIQFLYVDDICNIISFQILTTLGWKLSHVVFGNLS